MNPGTLSHEATDIVVHRTNFLCHSVKSPSANTATLSQRHFVDGKKSLGQICFNFILIVARAPSRRIITAARMQHSRVIDHQRLK